MTTWHERYARAWALLRALPKHWILFALILAIGVFARTWEYRALPPGIFTDEASIGVDSYYIGKYGMDRHGVSYPTQLTAFGQEQNAFYAYLLVPLIAIGGLKPVIVRLPMLVSGILTLPLVYGVARRIFTPRLGLLSMFFLAISPWHILLSRWGLDQNLLPFVFTLAIAALLASPQNGRWLIIACLLFGLCFYIYGPSYFIVPFVLGPSLWILFRRKLVDRGFLAAGIAAFCLMAISIAIFLLINSLRLSSLHVGAITIPRMPSTPRFLSQTGAIERSPGQALMGNLSSFLHILIGQTDGLIYNAFEPFGYFYKVTFPLALFGIVLLFRAQRREHDPAKTILLLWIAACLIFGVLQLVNINRINLIFIPLILCTALAIDWIGMRWRLLYPVSIVAFAAAFLWFSIAYHGPAYRAAIDHKFHKGLLPAIQYASSLSTGPVCVTDNIDMPYIFVLFAEQPELSSVLQTIQYGNPANDLFPVRSMTRYRFGAENCPSLEPPVYVWSTDEVPPHLGQRYHYQFFDEFVVYYPKP